MEQTLRVGVITSTHGVRGEVKAFPTTDDAKRFKKLKHVMIDTGKELKPMEIEQVKFFKNMVIVKFKGFDNIVVGPHLQAGHLVNGLALGGEHDDRGFVGLPNFGADRPAIHHRKHNVQEDQVRAKEAIELQCFAAISGDHGFIAFFF